MKKRTNLMRVVTDHKGFLMISGGVQRALGSANREIPWVRFGASP